MRMVFLLSLGTVTGMLLTSASGETPVPKGTPLPEICNIQVALADTSWNVIVSWTGGTPPFVVMRGTADDFTQADSVEVIATDLFEREYSDHNAAKDGTHYYYLVYGENSVPEIFSIVPNGGRPGQPITIRGAAFSDDCTENSVYFAGKSARITEDCRFDRIVFAVPEDAVTGYVVVSSPGGAGFPGHHNYCRGHKLSPRSW